MPNALRTITPYDPDVDFAERWPTWSVTYEDGSDAYEMFDELLHELTLCVGALNGVLEKAAALTHAICHLDLGHLDCDDITSQQEAEADCLAEIKQL